jgi:GNAT superfamily N-acetyltransferase
MDAVPEALMKKHDRVPDEPLLRPRWVRLRDDKAYLLRILHPDDEELLQAFFKSHSEDTIHERYGYLISSMTWERAHELVGVDPQRDPALAILEVGNKNKETIHAVGRYYWNEKANSAEMAFVVRETKRRMGMSSLLLETLASLARRRKIEKLWAMVLPSNSAMLNVLKKEGFYVTSREPDEVMLEKKL